MLRNQPVDGLELEDIGEVEQRDRQARADGHLHGPSPADEDEDLVDQQRDQRDVDDITPAQAGPAERL
jgi:hypothetical protein